PPRSSDQRWYVSDTRSLARTVGFRAKTSPRVGLERTFEWLTRELHGSVRTRSAAKKSAKVALVNPPWSFDRSVYFGCREAHLPLEYGYAKALLEECGNDVLIVDGQLGFTWRTGERDADLDASGAAGGDAAIREAIARFGPDVTV